jgi:hypothetical protein
MFDKKKLKGVKNKDIALSIIRKEGQNLVKYRHPKILNIVETLREDKNALGFVTERVVGSL